MTNYLKSFKEIVEGLPGLVIMITISVLPLFLHWPNFDFVFSAIGTIIMISVISAIAIWLTIKQKHLLAAVIVLISHGYIDGASRFINMILAFDFSEFARVFIMLLGFGWLVLVILTFIVFGDRPTHKKIDYKKELWLFIAFGYFYITFLFSGTIFIVLLALGLLLFTKRTLAYGFIAAHLFNSIMDNFQTLKIYIDFDALDQLEFRFYLFQAIAIAILVFIVIQIVQGFKTDLLIDDNALIETKE